MPYNPVNPVKKSIKYFIFRMKNAKIFAFFAANTGHPEPQTPQL